MKVNVSVANGQMMAPPSKSMAHRYLICAALSNGTSKIHNVDFSQDIKATLECIKALGAKVNIQPDYVEITGCNTPGLENNNTSPAVFNCNESGSTLRFFIPLAMLKETPAVFHGSYTLLHRPLSIYETICQTQNISFSTGDEIKVHGKLKPGTFVIPGDISSQFITGLLFALPLLNEDSTIKITKKFESRSYVEMSLQVLREFGIEVKFLNKNTIFVKGNQAYKPQETSVEGDYSNAAFFDAFNTLNGNVNLSCLKEDSLQGDKIYLKYFQMLKEKKCRLDLKNCPDLGPILFVIAALHHGATFTGTKRLKIKESNRGQVMKEELAKFGVNMKVYNNHIVIKKGEIKAPQQILDGHNDHRIVMSLVTMLSQTGGRIEGVQAVRKSLPDYFIRIKKLGIQLETENDQEAKLLEEQK